MNVVALAMYRIAFTLGFSFQEFMYMLIYNKISECLTPAFTVIVALAPRLIVSPLFRIRRLIPKDPGLPPIMVKV